MKKIGIVGSVKHGMFGADIKYMEFAAKFGQVHLLTPDMPVQDLDLLILKGGADVSFNAQGQFSYMTGASNPFLEYFDEHILPEYIERRIPIFGICRGMQALNVMFGGTLKHHLYFHPTNGQDRSYKVHHVTNKDKEHLFKVNSIHHQCVKELGEGLRPLLYSTNEKAEKLGHIEAFEHETLPIVAVQWHPEEIMDSFSLGAVETLLNLDTEGEEGCNA